jgi:hypothetical protein
VKLIDWLVDRLKAEEPKSMGIGRLDASIALLTNFEQAYSPTSLSACAEEYMMAVFENIADQSEKISCSPKIRWLSAEILAYAYRGFGGCPDMGAHYFISLLSDALGLDGQLLLTKSGNTSRVTSTNRFHKRFGFKCDVEIKPRTYVEVGSGL